MSPGFFQFHVLAPSVGEIKLFGGKKRGIFQGDELYWQYIGCSGWKETKGSLRKLGMTV